MTPEPDIPAHQKLANLESMVNELLDEAASWIAWALEQGDIRGTNGETAGRNLLDRIRP